MKGAKGQCQGVQIGRIFASWARVYLENVLESYLSGTYLGLLFSWDKQLSVNFDKKMGWATFWAILSQTHLVTLVNVMILQIY
jgi:hypothetical protein